MANIALSGLHENFLKLVRLGIGTSKDAKIPKEVDWNALKMLAEEQGLAALVLDGLDRVQEVQGSSMSEAAKPSARFQETLPLELKLEWIGEVLQDYEGRYAQYKKAIGSLAGFYNQNGFKMMVLKGYACSLDWPKPEHRPCGDMDIWQFGKQKEADAALFNESKIEIDGGQHHHTVFEWQGFTVENHYDFINVHHHPSHRGLETIFKELGQESHTDITDNTEIGMQHQCVDVCGEKVYIPSPNLHALFLLRHALNHFPSIGINLRNVLDWAFFIEKHTKEIDWKWVDKVIDEYHMRDFYNCINAICVEDLGFSASIFPSVHFLPSIKEKVLKDILDPEFTIDEPSGLFRKWIHKYRRWRGNRWKQELCYQESMWSAFWSGIWSHLVKPKAY